jgi:hypothetical protein
VNWLRSRFDMTTEFGWWLIGFVCICCAAMCLALLAIVARSVLWVAQVLGLVGVEE